MKLHHYSSTNGKVEAPSQFSGASAVSSQQTVFPQADLKPSWITTLYALNRYTISGVTLLRWALTIVPLAALIWGVGRFPGRWWGAALWIILWVLLIATNIYWRRRDFVRFAPSSLPATASGPLVPSDKIAIYVTGYLTVEEKHQRFTWVPGFFRTFATREHALICQLTQQRFVGIAEWPETELGLWYLFFHPRDIAAVEWGELCFGRDRTTAIAVTYHRTIPARGRFRPERTATEVVYLAVANDTDGLAILADLQYDRPLALQSQPTSKFN